MFGLMQFHACRKTDEERARQRLLYCGTCKSIGTLYGQASRLFLNNDVVFLAQLLDRIASPDNKSSDPKNNLANAYRNYNCFALPLESEIPKTMRVASAVCVALAGLKVEDQLEDTRSGALKNKWTVAAKVYSKSFRSCFDELESFGFPRNVFAQLTQRQSDAERLANVDSESNSIGRLDQFADETAHVTGVVFRHAALAVGSSSECAGTMEEVGRAFGKIIYLLDALDDYRKDWRRKQFNAVSSAFAFNSMYLPQTAIDSVTMLISSNANTVLNSLASLPIVADEFQSHQQTLNRNLLRRVNHVYDSWSYARTHSLDFALRAHSKQHSCKRHSSKACLNSAPILDFDYAVQRARELTGVQDCEPWTRAMLPLIFIWVFFVALVVPSQSRLLESYHEHLELSFNLIFWGTAVASFIHIIRNGPDKLQYAFAMAADGHGSGDESNREPHHKPGGGKPFKDKGDEGEINLVPTEDAEPTQEYTKGRFHKKSRLPKNYQGTAAGTGAGCLCCDSMGVCGDECFYTTPRRSKGECCCLECDDCCACGCEGGCDMCSSTECCTGGHCCAAEHCCVGADCCAAADCSGCAGCADGCGAIDCGAASC